MTSTEFARHLRTVASYHLGIDLAARLVDAQQFQNQQRQALEEAAARIEELQAQVVTLQAANQQRETQCG